MADQHTSGPWVATDAGEVLAQTARAWPLIARVVFQGLDTNPQWRENARLIAAAPTLFTALKNLATEARDRVQPSIAAEAQAAIDKVLHG